MLMSGKANRFPLEVDQRGVKVGATKGDIVGPKVMAPYFDKNIDQSFHSRASSFLMIERLATAE
jgi:hypothetical protein